VVPVPDLQMLYVLAVIAAAVSFGRGPAMLASAISVAAYDFLFVPPYYTFQVHDGAYVLTFAMLFGVGWISGTLAMRARRLATEQMRRMDRLKGE
jgi:two-component system, OmpR family, sensor histidine kinase KdpD